MKFGDLFDGPIENGRFFHLKKFLFFFVLKKKCSVSLLDRFLRSEREHERYSDWRDVVSNVPSLEDRTDCEQSGKPMEFGLMGLPTEKSFLLSAFDVRSAMIDVKNNRSRRVPSDVLDSRSFLLCNFSFLKREIIFVFLR